MKNCLATLITLFALLAGASRTSAQGTAFTYQGRLNSGTNPANGVYDFQSLLFTNATSGPPLIGVFASNLGVGVTNGLFTMTMQFLPGNPFSAGQPLWLDLSVRTNGSGAYTNLSPRQKITPVPYATYAATAASYTGAVADSQLSANIPRVNGPADFNVTLNALGFVGDGSGLTGLNASQINQGTVPDSVLGANVILRGTNNTFAGTNTFAGVVIATNANNVLKGVLTGNATTATTANNFSGSLAGDVTGTQGATAVAAVGGQSAANVASGASAANAATTANVANTIVKRDSSGSVFANVVYATTFSGSAAGLINIPAASILGGTIGNNTTGNATTATLATNALAVTGNGTIMSTNFTGNGAGITNLGLGSFNLSVSTNLALLNGTNLFTGTNTFAGVFNATNLSNTFKGTLTGNASTATSATSFSGSLAGDVTGTQGATVVASVGGQTAANVAGGASAANAAASANTASTLVKRDASGNFSAGAITASFVGNGAGLTNLNASQLTNGTVGDARLSGNVVLLNASQTVTGAKAFSAELAANNSIRLNGSNVWLLGGSDFNHGLGYFGTSKPFGGTTPDGPVLFGYGGGELGSSSGGYHPVLAWTPSAVGIGTTTPATPLHVYNSAQILATFENTNSGGAWINLANTSPGGHTWNFISTASGNVEGPGKLLFRDGAQGVMMTLSTNGNVGVGTNDPQSALHVVGTVTADAFTGNTVVVPGTSQTAQPNRNYLLTNDALVTVTLPAAPNQGDLVRVSGTGQNGWKIVQNIIQSVRANNLPGNIGANWIWRDARRDWNAVASSAAGNKLVALVAGGQIYTSTDSGVTWTPRDSVRAWVGVASSADGSKLVATVTGGQIYTSTDSGVTWIPRDSGRNWYGVASSADGSKLVAVVDGGQIYTSTDSGLTWTPRDTSRSWKRVASSEDGSKLVAVVGGGQIYSSADSGLTWAPRDSSRSWSCVASSADGSKLIAAVSVGQIYTSTDSGVTWTPRYISAGWTAVASSADGSQLVATAYNNDINTSTDSGITWTHRYGNWTPSPSSSPYCVASSADGTKLVVGYSPYGPILTSAQSSTAGTTGYLLGGPNAAIELQYIGNGEFIPVSHEGSITVY